MVAPFTRDGTDVYALVHNEFHGEWTGSPRWCAEQRPQIYLPCNYWNLVSASSADGGQHFALRQVRPDWNVPAIALAAPYTPNAIGPHPVPQGMAAQTNMIEHNGFVYVLAQQLATASLVPERDNGGMCLFRAPAPLNPETVWQGWAGAESGWIDLPASYPRAPDPPPCAKVLPGAFRFSWSYNPMLQQFILLGLVSGSANQSTCPPADPTVGQSDTAFVYMTATADLPNGRFTIATPQTCSCESIGSTVGEDPGQTRLARRPSLLDPMSPTLNRGASIDLNFQYSGTRPYLYYTRLNAYAAAGFLNHRDVVRWKLSVSRAAAAAPQ